MAKIACKCGNVIRISGPIPNPEEWRYISDPELEDIAGKESKNLNDLYAELKSFFKCQQCGRLWFFEEDFSKPPVSYIEEK